MRIEDVAFNNPGPGEVLVRMMASGVCTRSRGITVWVGHAPYGTPVTIDARDLIAEKTVIGSMYGTAKPRSSSRACSASTRRAS